eukprot:Pgem_evm1s11138
MEQAFPDFEVLINPTKPRSKAFELVLKLDGEDDIIIWTGLKKGPPRKLKWPENLYELCKEKIQEY